MGFDSQLVLQRRFHTRIGDGDSFQTVKFDKVNASARARYRLVRALSSPDCLSVCVEAQLLLSHVSHRGRKVRRDFFARNQETPEWASAGFVDYCLILAVRPLERNLKGAAVCAAKKTSSFDQNMAAGKRRNMPSLAEKKLVLWGRARAEKRPPPCPGGTRPNWGDDAPRLARVLGCSSLCT